MFLPARKAPAIIVRNAHLAFAGQFLVLSPPLSTGYCCWLFYGDLVLYPTLTTVSHVKFLTYRGGTILTTDFLQSGGPL